MSHFSVMVITAEKPTNDTLGAILQPWHEFECTGTDDQYVIEVDETAEKRAEYESSTQRKYRDADGALHSPYDDRFYREPTAEETKHIGRIAGTGCGHGISWHSKDWNDGRGYRAKVHFLPEGFEETEVPSLHLQTFREWLADDTGRDEVLAGAPIDLGKAHKYGFTELDGDGSVVRTVDRTNPNSKWDWWVVGGRWKGLLQSSDIVQIKDIPVSALRDKSEREALEQYDRRIAAVAGRPIPSWDNLREAHGIAEARRLFWDDPVVLAVKAAEGKDGVWIGADEIEALRLSRQETARQARAKALSTFAVVKDGQWHERGEMGWFACVGNEKDRDTWDREFAALLDGLSPETWVTIVDCHI